MGDSFLSFRVVLDLDLDTLLGAGGLLRGSSSSLICLMCLNDWTEVMRSWRDGAQVTPSECVQSGRQDVHTLYPSDVNLDQGSARLSTEKVSFVTRNRWGDTVRLSKDPGPL